MGTSLSLGSPIVFFGNRAYINFAFAEHKIEAVNIESIPARERIGADISLVAKAVDLNAAFDESGQLMDVVEGDTRKLEDIMRSVAENVLDGPT